MQLNPHQEEVANHLTGRILTLAGPGSGKTRTLTERTARLIRRGVDPGHILCLTFTNKARDEMRQRIAVAVKGDGASKVTISNFHGLCGVLLRRLGPPLGYSPRMTICDSDDQIDLLMQVARRRGMEPTKPQARGIASVINEWRENLGSEKELRDLAETRLRDGELEVAKRYLDVLRSRQQIDFSGLLAETVRLLREHEPIREQLQRKYRFIQVDEFQDTNRAQHEIVELLAGPADNVLAVGDGDQSIYEWRGASPDGITNFIKNGQAKTGKCRIVKLGVNYRSTPQIIEVADKLIRNASNRIPVEFSSVHASGEAVKCVRFKTPADEAEAVAHDIEQLIRREHLPAREIAIFYRTNDMSRLVEQSLAKRQIPYSVIGSGSYYDRMEVKDVLSMLRFVCNPRDGISFARIANKPARGMGDALIGKLETLAETHHIDLLAAMDEPALRALRDEGALSDAAVNACRETRRIFTIDAQRDVGGIAQQLLDRTRYEQWLKDRYEEKGEYESRSRNVNELLNSIMEFSRTNPRTTIADYLQSISLYTEADGIKDENAVRLMSLHASKGLEFDAVYMIGVERGILPHEKAIADRPERGLEEERRLCYVGFTRARKRLRVAYCAQRQETFARDRTASFRPVLPSQFLVESGLLTREQYDAALKEHADTRPANAGKTKTRAIKSGRPSRRAG